MSWLFGDTFDSYATADYALRYSHIMETPTISAGTGRSGTNAGKFEGQAEIGYGVAPGSATNFHQMVFKSDNLSSELGLIAVVDGVNGVAQIIYSVKTDGSIAAYRVTGIPTGGHYLQAATVTLLGTSASGLITPNTYNSLEVKTTLHASAGVINVRVNGAPNKINLTGQNTVNSSAVGASYTMVVVGHGRVLGAGDHSAVYIDIHYSIDDQGSQCNTFLGDLEGEYTAPSGNGTTNQFTKNSGATNASCVDDATPDGDATYVEDDTIGHVDLYTHGALSRIASGIQCAQHLNVARKTTGGTRAMAAALRISGTNHFGADKFLSTDYATKLTPFELNPDTSAAWAVAEVNAAEIGEKITV